MKVSLPTSDEINTITINLLGTNFSITAKEDLTYMTAVIDEFASYLEQAQKSAPFKDDLRVAILAGILATNNLAKNRQDATVFDRENGEIKNFLKTLEELL